MIHIADYFIDPEAIFAVRWRSLDYPNSISQRRLQAFLRYPIECGNALICEPGQEDAVLEAVGQKLGRVA